MAEPERGHGRVLNVTGVDLSDELVAPVSVGDSTLFVGDVADFDEDGGWLNLNDAVVEFVTVDDEASTITLAAPIGVAGEQFDTVVLWSGPGGMAVREFVADIVLDDQEGGDSLAATLDHSLIDKLPEGVRDGRGESVEWERDGSELEVVGILGKVPQTDDKYLTVPNSLSILPADKPLAGGAWTRIDNTFVFDENGVETGFDGIVRPGVGVFGYSCTATFESNGSGGRGLRSRIHFANGDTAIDVQIKTVPVDADASVQIANYYRFADLGAVGISFEAFQSSGGTLNLRGSDGGVANRRTQWTVARLAP